MYKIEYYETHLTEGQWSYINKMFFENDCRKRKYSLRDIFEAVLYLLVSGCQWRMLPHDCPHWESVYYYYKKWRLNGWVEDFMKKLVRNIRSKRSQRESPTVGALDAQSVKWGNHKSDNGFDGNKKVKGIKRSIIVDRNGYILSRKVSSAGLHDVHSVKPLCQDASSEWEGLKKILVDRGYRGEIADEIRRDFNIDIEVSNTPDGVKGFTPKPLRWVVERTFSWLDLFRRLARNYEQLPEASEEMIDFAAIKILLNQI